MLALALWGGLSFAHAQQSASSQPSTAKVQPAKTKEEKPAAQQPQATNSPKKKDGTPDMRYKQNKQAKQAGPKKADGTPDMRYKQNKEAAKKSNQ